MLSQDYRVKRIETRHPVFRTLDFESSDIFDCRMFVKSLHSARLIVTKPRSLFSGMFSLKRIWPLRLPLVLSHIYYTIIATPGDDRTVLTQDFHHPFTSNVLLLLDGEMRATDGPLFTREKLSGLLKSNAFNGTYGVQFIA